MIPEIIKEFLDANPNAGRNKIAEVFGISEQEARIYCRLYKGRKDDIKDVKMGVAVYDLHYPEHDEPSWNIVKEFVKDEKPDIFIYGGDQMDMGAISWHDRNSPRIREGRRLRREFKGFQKEMNEVEGLLSDDCKKYFMIGNHEFRLDRALDAEPQYEGLLEMEYNLDLEDYKIVPFNEALNLGEMWFIHGNYYNKYHAEKNTRIYGKHVFSGHAHTNQIYTMHSPTNYLPRQGVSVGCLCNKNPDYMRNQPNAWVHQFLYFYLYENGSFTYYTPLIINGRCVINGKYYEG